eukprot:jgi/Galph1/2852/GphlegSOOS_G1531.1
MNQDVSVLSDDVIEKIHSDEIIQNPVDVVRELIENAIDAKANMITVEWQEEEQKIRVIDNGMGMSLPNLKRCILSHTTSKIRTVDDLDHNIHTLGFRGQALWAISVLSSSVVIMSRPAGEQVGYRLKSCNRKQENYQISPVSITSGTCVEVSLMDWDISFSNWYRQVQWHFQKTALIHSHISFRLRKRRKERKPALIYQKCSGLLERTSQIFNIPSQELRYYQLEVPNKENLAIGMVQVVIGLPERIHRSRNDWMFLIVNGRESEDNSLSQLIMDKTKKMVPSGRYPLCLVMIDLKPTHVKWDPSPQKKRFQMASSEIETLLSCISICIDKALYTTDTVYEDALDIPKALTLTTKTERDDELFPMPFQGWKVIGQAKNTYIVVETDSSILLVEQHVAHERVLYEKLCKLLATKENHQHTFSQPMLLTGVTELAMYRLKQLCCRVRMLDDSGCWVVDAVPQLLYDICQKKSSSLELQLLQIANPQRNIEDSLADFACQSAYNNGKALSVTEMTRTDYSFSVAKRALDSLAATIQRAPFLSPADECQCKQSIQVLKDFLLQLTHSEKSILTKCLEFLSGKSSEETDQARHQFIVSILRTLVYAYQQFRNTPRLVIVVSIVLDTLGKVTPFLDSGNMQPLLAVLQHAALLSTKRQWKGLLTGLCKTAVLVTPYVDDIVSTEIVKAAFEVTSSSNWTLREHILIGALVEGTILSLRPSARQEFLQRIVSTARTTLERRSDMQSRGLGFMILMGALRTWKTENALDASYRNIHNLLKQEQQRALQDSICTSNITSEQDFNTILYTVTVSCGITACHKQIESISSAVFILVHCLDYISSPFLRRQKFFQPLCDDSWNIFCHHTTSIGYAAAECVLQSPTQSNVSFFLETVRNVCREIFSSCRTQPVSQEILSEKAKSSALGTWKLVYSFSFRIFQRIQESSLEEEISNILRNKAIILLLDSISMLCYFCPSPEERQTLVECALEASISSSTKKEFSSHFEQEIFDYWLETTQSHWDDLINVSNGRNRQLIASCRVNCLLDLMLSSLPRFNVSLLKQRQEQLFSSLFSILNLDIQSLVLSCHAIFRRGLECEKHQIVFCPYVLSYWKQTLMQYPKTLSAVDLISSLDAILLGTKENRTISLYDVWNGNNEEHWSSKAVVSNEDILYNCLLHLENVIIEHIGQKSESQMTRNLSIILARCILKCSVPSLYIVFDVWEHLLYQLEPHMLFPFLTLLRQVVDGLDAVRKPRGVQWFYELALALSVPSSL